MAWAAQLFLDVQPMIVLDCSGPSQAPVALTAHAAEGWGIWDADIAPQAVQMKAGRCHGHPKAESETPKIN